MGTFKRSPRSRLAWRHHGCDRAHRSRLRRKRDRIAAVSAAGSASRICFGSHAGSPSGSADTGYSGPPASLEYSIWGDPAEIKNQQAVVEAFTAANPTIKVNVTVSDWEPYWDKLQTGLAGGAAPDVFAMDGPLGPDYQTRDVLLDLTPYIQGESYDLGQLDANAVKDFTTADGAQFGLPRDLNVIALYLQQDHVRRGLDRLPRRHLGLGETRRGRQAADQGHQR
jgi:multiple sugar transport system substrate-binding protein